MPQSWSDLAREASDRAHPPAACAQLNNIARIAGKLFGGQAALIWLADPISAAVSDQRRFGQIDCEIEGESSVFTAVMADPDGLVVLDAGIDARFAEYPSVRFFAGLPLLNGAGAAVGTLCVMDTAPRGPLSADLLGDLRTMAKTAVATIQQAEMAHWDAAPIPTGSELTAGSEPQRINRRFETLADALPQLVWSTPNDGLSDYFSRQWCKFTGAPASASYGTGWLNFVHPEDVPAADEAWAIAIKSGEPYIVEFRLLKADGTYRWMLARGLPVIDDSGAITRWIGTCTDIDERVRSADLLEFMSRELSHRIKNMFAVMQGLISMALRKHDGMAQVSQSLQLRMVALGRAHDLVRPRFAEGAIMRSQTTLRDLVRILTLPYIEDDPTRLEIAGDDTVIDEHAATPLALFFHEMAINSAMFGALSSPQGRLQIALSVGDGVTVKWRESLGPVIAAPPVPAFGLGLTRLTIERQLGGTLTMDWQPGGLQATAQIPLRQLHAE